MQPRLRIKQILQLVVAVLLIVVLTALVRLPPDQWEQAQAWGEALQDQGVGGALQLLLIGALATSVGLPRQLVAFVAGFAFNVVPGLVLSLLAAIVGCALTVVASRTVLRIWVRNRYPEMIETLETFMAHDPFLKILILRLQPLGTNLITNLCAGLTAIPLPLFLVSSLLGYVPQMLVFSLIGSGIRVGSSVQLVVSAVLLIVSLLLGVVLYRRHVSRQRGAGPA